MRRALLTGVSIGAALALASSSLALERRSMQTTEEPGGWNTASSCHISYYNVCTLWSWAWGGFAPGDRFGVASPRCRALGDILLQTQTRIATGAPSGYVYTGTIAVHNADLNGCPIGAPLQSQPWLPTAGDQVHLWSVGIPNATFALVYTFGPSGEGPARIMTDHPAAGPTGPMACGRCYPLTRVNHSFYWGTASTPLCPGSEFFDGICDAQLRVDEFFSPGIGGIAVTPQSWGEIKTLYR